MSSFNIFIPSKSRANDSILLKHLNNKRLPFHVVVEPQDAKKYLETYPYGKIIILPKNNGGIAYVRQYILEYAHSKKMTWIWMLDDDISPQISVIDRNNKLSKKSLYATMQQIITESFQRGFPKAYKIDINKHIDKIAQIGFKHVLWLREYPKYSINAQVVCNQITALNVPLLQKHQIGYHPGLNFREDIDLTLQIMQSGLLTVRFNRYGYDCNHRRDYKKLKTQKNGGMSKLFNNMNLEKQNKILLQRFGKYLTNTTNGKIKVNLSSFKREFY